MRTEAFWFFIISIIILFNRTPFRWIILCPLIAAFDGTYFPRYTVAFEFIQSQTDSRGQMALHCSCEEAPVVLVQASETANRLSQFHYTNRRTHDAWFIIDKWIGAGMKQVGIFHFRCI